MFFKCLVTHQWSRPVVHGQPPRARDGHSACIINDRMYIFGGYEEELDQFSHDVYALDMRSMTWSQVKTKVFALLIFYCCHSLVEEYFYMWCLYALSQGATPQRRDFHTATAIGHNMYIFGGRGGRIGFFYSQEDEIYCNQIMRLDTRSQTWHKLETTGECPVGRRSHSACNLFFISYISVVLLLIIVNVCMLILCFSSSWKPIVYFWWLQRSGKSSLCRSL